MSVLMINNDSFKSAQDKYNAQAQRMIELRAKMITAINDIRGGWRSDGADAFFEKFDVQWLKNFTDYTEVISHMAKNLSSTDHMYQEVVDSAERIKLE